MSPWPISVSAAWTATGWTMLHLVWIGAAAGLAAALLRRLLRQARPEVRHGTAVACLLFLTAAPAPLFVWLYRPETALDIAHVHSSRAAAPDGQAADVTAPLPALELRRPGAGLPAAPAPAPLSSRFEMLIPYLPGVWLSGSLVTLALVATGLVGVERLRRSSRPLEADAIARRCRALADSLGVARRVGVAVCDRLAVPVLVGILRPMIILPAAALGGWSIEQVEMALLHELAHIRRHDNLITLLQRLAESLLFFHPATWWLSAWVSLERELCCDRLVVERTGRPQDYARMLAALAGACAGAPPMALAMAERPITTRIRRILDMEDRSMKMTLTEGLGLLTVAIVATAATLAAHAKPPEPVAPGAARQMLERLAQRILALPDGVENSKDTGYPYDNKSIALIAIAQAQLKLGDRAAALATVRQLDGLAEPSPGKPGAKADLRTWTRFAAMAESAMIRRDAGDIDGARAVLDRAARHLEMLDHGAIREAIKRVGKEMDEAFAKKEEGPRRLNDEEAAFVSEASVVLIDQYIALGDMVRARTLIHRLIDNIGAPPGPAHTMFLGALGGYLTRAGEPEGGRDLIKRARQEALALPNQEARSFALPVVVQSMFEAGDLDDAFALVREMPPQAQPAAIGRILDQITTDDHSGAWFDPGGIAIKIGNPSMSPKDPARARVVLPRIAATTRASSDAKVQARTLAVVAHLQARAGDIAGGLATARSIRALKRSDFPGKSDGFYDAVKPVTFALIAGAQAKAGDPSAVETFGEAQSLTRAIAAADQKLVAQIAIARQQAECGRRDAVKAIVAEALPLALTQPEPRRSRVLTMLAEAQVRAADPDAALRTIDAIREYPGIEKVRALSILARWHEEAGNAPASAKLLGQAVACLESKAPATPLPGKVSTVQAIGRDTYIDFDLELEPGQVQYQRETMLQHALTSMGNVEAAVRSAEALPTARRDRDLSQIVGHLARRGDVNGAMNLATSIESRDVRLSAFITLAGAIPEVPAKK